MARFLLKINGQLEAPGGICRPRRADEWDGGEVILVHPEPVRVEGGADASPPVTAGDEIWIWTHEDEGFGGGLGLTAQAVAASVRPHPQGLAVQMRQVRLLPRAFGFRDIGHGEQVPSRLLRAVNRNRSPRAWLIEDVDWPELAALIDARSAPLSREVQVQLTSRWEQLISEHRDAILKGLDERRVALVRPRPGQQEFRARLLDQHGGRCIVTGCEVPEALAAAHILPHTGTPEFDDPENGLLLRADVHALFDAALLTIDATSNRVRLAPALRIGSYQMLDGRLVDHKAAPEVLQVHNRAFNRQHGRSSPKQSQARPT